MGYEARVKAGERIELQHKDSEEHITIRVRCGKAELDVEAHPDWIIYRVPVLQREQDC